MFNEVLEATQNVQREVTENMRDIVGASLDEEILQAMIKEIHGMQQAYETFEGDRSAVQTMLSTLRAMI